MDTKKKMQPKTWKRSYCSDCTH